MISFRSLGFGLTDEEKKLLTKINGRGSPSSLHVEAKVMLSVSMEDIHNSQSYKYFVEKIEKIEEKN